MKGHRGDGEEPLVIVPLEWKAEPASGASYCIQSEWIFNVLIAGT